MFSIISWLVLVILSGLTILWAVKARAITRYRQRSMLLLVPSALIIAAAIFLSQGWSTNCNMLLPGKYSMVGYQLVPEEAIYFFLQTRYGPKVCNIPWDAAKADKVRTGEKEGHQTEIEVKWGTDKQKGEGVPGFDDGGEIQPWSKPPTDIQIPKTDEGAT